MVGGVKASAQLSFSNISNLLHTSINKFTSRKGISGSIANFLKSGLLIILFAAAFAYFSNPVMFELRLQDIQDDTSDFINSLSEEKEEPPSLCGKNKQLLINNLNEHAEIDIGRLNSNAMLEYSGEGFANWKPTGLGRVMYDCSKGSEEGQDTNALYCEPSFEEGMTLERTITNEEGVIEETENFTITKITMENSNITDLRCSQ